MRQCQGTRKFTWVVGWYPAIRPKTGNPSAASETGLGGKGLLLLAPTVARVASAMIAVVRFMFSTSCASRSKN